MIDDFGLVEPDDGLCEGVIVTVAFAAKRRSDAGLSEPPGVAWNKVLLHFIQIRRDIAPEILISLISEEIL